MSPLESSHSEKCEAEPFDDGGGGVDLGKPEPAFGYFGERVDDGRGIHPDLREEGHQMAEIPVFGGERGKEKSESKSNQHQMQEHQGQHPGVGGQR